MFGWERRPGAPVDFFVFTAPPRRCLLLFTVVGHRRAAAMGASDNETNEDVNTTDLGRSSATDRTKKAKVKTPVITMC